MEQHKFSPQMEKRLRALVGICQHLQPIPTAHRALLPPLPDIKAVLFDIYGTLLISEIGDISVSQRIGCGTLKQAQLSPLLAWLSKCYRVEELVFQQIRLQHGISYHQGVKYPEVDIVDIWTNILQRRLPPEQQQLWPLTLETVALLAMEYELLVNQATLMPGTLSMLQAVNAAGLKMGIVSNAQFYTRYTLEGLAGVTIEEMGFQSALCSWSFEQQVGKPNPKIFTPPLQQLQQQGVAPSQVLFVGNDLKKDILPAQKLGLRTALFVGDQRSLRLYTQELGPVQADCQLTSITQVQQVLDLYRTT